MRLKSIALHEDLSFETVSDRNMCNMTNKSKNHLNSIIQETEKFINRSNIPDSGKTQFPTII